MSFEYLAYELSRGEEVVNPEIVGRCVLRDNPFYFTAGEFQKPFRLSPDLTEDLISQLESRDSRITAILTENQVLAALRFCYQRPVGEQCGISMSQSPMNRITDAITRSMFCANVRFPVTQVERKTAK